MYWIDILSRLHLVSFFLFLAGGVSAIPLMVALLKDDEINWKFLTLMTAISVTLMIIALILLITSTLVAFFAPLPEYIEFLKGGICE